MRYDTKHIHTLAEILRHGSFEAAAHAMGLTQSAVSQRIKALEEQFGSILVERGTPCKGTPAGVRLAAHAEAVALMEAALAEELGQTDAHPQAPRRARLAVNADSLATWLPAALDRSGRFSFDLVVDDESVSAEWLRRGLVMAAVTTQKAPIRGCDVHPLGAMRYVATAAPAFAARWLPTGPEPRAMAQAPMLCFDQNDTLQAGWLSQHIGAGLHPPVHMLPSTTGFVEATRAGLGWALNPLCLVEADLAAGTLVELLPGAHHDHALYWQVSRLMAPALAPVTGEIKRAAKRALQPIGQKRP